MSAAGPPVFRADTFYIQQALLVLLVNLLPLYFVFTGEWTPFEVIGFYWVEVVAAGVFAWLRAFVDCAAGFITKKFRSAFSHAGTLLFMPVHYGFFIVMTCFLVGSFLPEGTPTQKLADPLVPLRMVMHYIDFYKLFPFFMLWEAVVFLRHRWHAQQEPGFAIPNPVFDAYKRLAILFLSGFFGLFLAGALDNRIWGAVLLCVLKTACALLSLLAERYLKKLPEK